MAKGEAKVLLRFTLLNLAVMPASFYVATRFGLRGVCLVWLVVFPVVAAFWIAAVKRSVGFQWREYWLALQPSIVSTAAMVVVLLLMQIFVVVTLKPVLRLSIEVVVGAGVYLACLIVLFPGLLKQLRQFVQRDKTEPVVAAA